MGQQRALQLVDGSGGRAVQDAVDEDEEECFGGRGGGRAGRRRAASRRGLDESCRQGYRCVRPPVQREKSRRADVEAVMSVSRADRRLSPSGALVSSVRLLCEEFSTLQGNRSAKAPFPT
ncbi:hypothetical protein EYF80_059659 [Liparis tanakae]|uniref:Uncharacterized protein n=1 Tax=Liparis tanakae TaxID=230148 RepID=A0A4Z2ENP2_9TELE|nr:hypothetical protein EYF80_059659 [Liparis tanakae]